MNESLRNTPETPERRLSDRLDFYKLTMGQVALDHFPHAEVTFTLKNRAERRPLSEYVSAEALTQRLDRIRQEGFTPEEIAYFASLHAQQGGGRFDEPYLDHLASLELSDVRVEETEDDLAVSATGPWANVSLWETVVMSEANELYYEELMKAQGLDIAQLWAEGDARLTDKITRLKERPDIKFADFGTRRRFSAEWHEHVIKRLSTELPENFIGTSNPWFAYKFGLTPIGTYAHEMPMVYGALAEKEGRNPLDGHREMLEDWHDRYQGDLSIALTDTFTSDFFFSDFTPEQAEAWNGLRHDSGDPFEFGEKAIAFYEGYGVDPRTKTIVFSDGLDLDAIFALADYFKDRVNVVFGWGTGLTNDLGLRPNNFVMKATDVESTRTVKLSDVEGKHTGSDEDVERYQRLKEARLETARVYEALV